MAPSRFKKEVREKREVTPFADDPLAPADIPAEWRDIEAPVNFTWVVQDELAGMGWPKSRDQVNFLVKQGIDHLITLAADKIPPHYAFPELKWTMIPVEDFTGPAITDIKKFIQIMAEARRDGEVKTTCIQVCQQCNGLSISNKQNFSFQSAFSKSFKSIRWIRAANFASL